MGFLTLAELTIVRGSAYVSSDVIVWNAGKGVTEGMRPLPPRIDRARDRIEQAVSEIEASLTQRDAASGGDTVLSAEAERAKVENAALRETHEAAERRLDTAIHRLQEILRG